METENSVLPEDLPEETTRLLAQSKKPIVDGVPTEHMKALLE